MSPRICIGSAQFGLNYGITNKKGRVEIKEITKILKCAQKENIFLIDTAQSYGNAEENLGKSASDINNFKIISKLPSQTKNKFNKMDQLFWENNYQNMLKKLNKNKLEGFLLHDTNDLIKEGSEYLMDWLYSLMQRGLTKNIGVSIYSKDDLNGINFNLFKIVQLPLSIYDQRLLKDGTIKMLHEKGCFIFARSIFLQGLIVTKSSEWPKWINSNIIEHHKNLENLSRKKNSTLLDISIDFIRRQHELYAAVIGLTKINEFNSIISSWHQNQILNKSEQDLLALEDINLLDPRKWP